MDPYLMIALGAFSLLFGRKLFWCFVAIVGFFAGLDIGTPLLVGHSTFVIILIALGVGLLGALIAVLLQRLAAGVVGFLVAAHMVKVFNAEFNLIINEWLSIIQIALGLIGGMLLMCFFDVALIIVSSLFGSSLLVDGFGLVGTNREYAFLIFLAVGLVAQTLLYRRDRTAIAASSDE